MSDNGEDALDVERDTEPETVATTGLAHFVFLFVVNVISAALFAALVMTLSDLTGPFDTEEGLVVATSSESRSQRICTFVRGQSSGICRNGTAQSGTVFGQYLSGGEWMARTPDAVRAMRSEEGVVEVTTARLSGNVVRLEGERSWQQSRLIAVMFGFLGITWFGLGWLIFKGRNPSILKRRNVGEIAFIAAGAILGARLMWAWLEQNL